MTAQSIKRIADVENLEILEVLKENDAVQVFLVKKHDQTRILKTYPETSPSGILFNNSERMLRKLGLAHSVGRLNGYHYMITDYYGLDLKTMLNRGGLSKSQRRQIAINLVNQVQAIHQQKIVHNDIKPSNIVIDKAHQVRLIDFEEAVLLTEASGNHLRSNRSKDVQDLTAVLKLLNPNFGRSLIDKTRTLGALQAKLKIAPPFRTLRFGITGAVVILCSIITFDTVSATVANLGSADATETSAAEVSSSAEVASVSRNSSSAERSSSLAAELREVAVESGIADPGVLPLVTVLSSNFNSADPRSASARAQAGGGATADSAAAPEPPAPTPTPTSDPTPQSSNPGPSSPPTSEASSPSPSAPSATQTPVKPDPTPTIKPQPTPEPSPDSEVIVIN